MHGQIKAEWKDKVDMFALHYRDGLTMTVIAERKNLSKQYVSVCIAEVWEFLMKERIL